jgi:hypothetical protein
MRSHSCSSNISSQASKIEVGLLPLHAKEITRWVVVSVDNDKQLPKTLGKIVKEASRGEARLRGEVRDPSGSRVGVRTLYPLWR